jgi:VWFA-related protein
MISSLSRAKNGARQARRITTLAVSIRLMVSIWLGISLLGSALLNWSSASFVCVQAKGHFQTTLSTPTTFLKFKDTNDFNTASSFSSFNSANGFKLNTIATPPNCRLLAAQPQNDGTSSSSSPSATVTEDEEVIKLTTELVSFDVQVFDRRLRQPVGGLVLENFEIYDENKKQEITYFSQDRLPLSVLLLLDISRSTQPFFSLIKASALRALKLLKPEDEVSVMAFSSQYSAIDGYTTNKAVIPDYIDELLTRGSSGGYTFATEALQASRTHLDRYATKGARKVVILITDNIFNSPVNGYRASTVIDNLLQDNITVCGLLIGLKPLFRAPPTVGSHYWGAQQPPAGRVRSQDVGDAYQYAAQTGGEVFDLRRDFIVGEELRNPINSNFGQEFTLSFVQLIENLRARYSLAYVPPTDPKRAGQFRQVRVKVVKAKSNPILVKDLVVRTRRGYFAK